MNQKAFLRIALNIFIILSIFTLPFYIQIALIVLGIFLFEFFWESVLFGLVLDALFGVPIDMFFGFEYLYTLMLVVLFLIIQWIKKITR